MLQKQSINHGQANPRRQKKTRREEDPYRREEDDLEEGWKKTQPKKTAFSDRLIYCAFRLALAYPEIPE